MKMRVRVGKHADNVYSDDCKKVLFTDYLGEEIWLDRDYLDGSREPKRRAEIIKDIADRSLVKVERVFGLGCPHGDIFNSDFVQADGPGLKPKNLAERDPNKFERLSDDGMPLHETAERMGALTKQRDQFAQDNALLRAKLQQLEERGQTNGNGATADPSSQGGEGSGHSSPATATAAPVTGGGTPVLAGAGQGSGKGGARR